MAATRQECAVKGTKEAANCMTDLRPTLFFHNRCEQKFESFIACLLNETASEES